MSDQRNFLKRDEGSVSIETLLWLPMIIIVLGLIFDAASLFHQYPRISRAVQEAHRSLSVNKLKDAASTEAFIETQLASISSKADATTTITGDVVTTDVVIPASDIPMIGMFAILAGVQIKISGAHVLEKNYVM